MSTSQWSFDSFRLDLAHVCLWRDTQVVPLPPKAFDVLHYLVTHPDRVVTKDELLDAVWSQTTVSEAAVRVAIGVLRKALDDTAQTPRYIATVARRGYRFVALVTAETAEGPGAAASATPTAHEPPLSSLPLAPVRASSVLSTPPPADVPTGTMPLGEAERRLLTVWFCDLVDSTRLAGCLDPEDYREVVRAYHQTCAEVIQRFDGYIAQYLGDGVLGYFGYPVAHEDDAQRAVRAGLGLLEALDFLNARLALPSGERLAVRLGVHTGLVVIGEVGTGTFQEPLALGETPNLAARLQQLATPNTLLISAATFQLVAGYFTYERLGAQALKGLAQPLPVYRVLGASGAQSRLDVAATRALTPLVGRDAEVALLLERWRRVQAGQGQVVLLVGEAGLGKSRLVHVLQDHLAAETPVVLEGRGSPYYEHTALYPVVDLLQRHLQWRPGEAPDVALHRLETLLTQAQLPLAEAVPLLATLLELPLTAASALPLTLEPEQQRQRTFDLLLALVGGLAERQPVLLVFEDLHWVDPSTLEWLTRLLDEVPTTRLYCVLTCRPTFQSPWGFRTYLTPLALAPLTPPQVETMVEEMAGSHRLAPAVRRQIVAQTDGNPLFVEEVTKAVVEIGPVTDAPASGAAAHTGLPVAIPVTLHEALLARLDRLGSAKSVAQLGAILGRQFSYALLRAVAPLEDEPLQRELAALVAAEIVYQRRQPPQAVYTFKHALLQEAAYTSVLQRERRQAHRRILQVLAGQVLETGVPAPALLAHHALRGEQWEQAVAYFREAGEQAIARSAYREAVGAFEQALEVIPHLPEHHDTLVQTLALHLALRNALWTLGELSPLFVHLQHAAALAETLRDTSQLGWVMVYLVIHFVVTGELDRALQYGQRALAMATTLEDMRLTVISRSYLGLVYRGLGDYPHAIECYRENVACLRGVPLQERLGTAGLVSEPHRHLAGCLAECGAFAAGRASAEEGVRIAEVAGNPYGLAMAYAGAGLLALRQGDLLQALPRFERALDLAAGMDIEIGAPWITSLLGSAYTLAGRIAEALPLLERAVTQAAARRFMFDYSRLAVNLGEAYLYAGRLDEASTQAQRVLEFARAHQERSQIAYALRLLGAIAAQREPPESAQAEAYYRQALALAEVLGMCPLQAHCHRQLGILYYQSRRHAEARTALATARTMYRAMEMLFWLPETEATLAEVGDTGT